MKLLWVPCWNLLSIIWKLLVLSEGHSFINLNLACCWSFCRGEFRIHHTASRSRFYDVFEARPPLMVNRKVLAFSSQMPAVLQLEPRPALKDLTEIFGDDSPKLHDIALYFFPSQQTHRLAFYFIFFFFFSFGVSRTSIYCLSSYVYTCLRCRSRKILDMILRFMNGEKSMLRSGIDGVELLIFTSDQLDVDSKGA